MINCSKSKAAELLRTMFISGLRVNKELARHLYTKAGWDVPDYLQGDDAVKLQDDVLQGLGT